MAEFVEAEGLVHVVSPIQGGEFTLCGDAFDLNSDEPSYRWKQTNKKVVTCRSCAIVIREVRNIKFYMEP